MPYWRGLPELRRRLLVPAYVTFVGRQRAASALFRHAVLARIAGTASKTPCSGLQKRYGLQNIGGSTCGHLVVIQRKKPTSLLIERRRLFVSDDPYGTRTRVAAVKGQCPRPLDEGAVQAFLRVSTINKSEHRLVDVVEVSFLRRVRRFVKGPIESFPILKIQPRCRLMGERIFALRFNRRI